MSPHLRIILTHNRTFYNATVDSVTVSGGFQTKFLPIPVNYPYGTKNGSFISYIGGFERSKPSRVAYGDLADFLAPDAPYIPTKNVVDTALKASYADMNRKLDDLGVSNLVIPWNLEVTSPGEMYDQVLYFLGSSQEFYALSSDNRVIGTPIIVSTFNHTLGV